MKLRIALFITFVFLGQTLVFAEQTSFKFCHSGPRTEVVTASDPSTFTRCAGTKTHIQGIMWKCDKKELNTANTQAFFSTLKEQARSKCVEFCRELGDRFKEKCRARFEAPTECGFSANPNRPGTIDERFGCQDRCEGKVVSYCSLYHGSFLRVEPSLIVNQEANCFCDPVK